MRNTFSNSRSRGKAKRNAQRSGDTSGFKSGGDAAHNASKGSKPLKNEKLSSRRHVNPLYVVLTRFRKVFASYDENEQNTETKRLALNIAVGMSRDHYPDRFRFWQDLRDQANLVLDSKRFERECNEWGLDPQAVAEHLVVEGKSTLNFVLKNGLKAYGEKARMFKDPLYSDTRGLYVHPDHE